MRIISYFVQNDEPSAAFKKAYGKTMGEWRSGS